MYFFQGLFSFKLSRSSRTRFSWQKGHVPFPFGHKTVPHTTPFCAQGSKVSAEQVRLQAMSGEKGEDRGWGH